MLRHIAQTLEHGSIGLYHELIPEGLTNLQLWSASTFVRGVVEDLLGVDVRAHQHALTVAPQLPAAWDFAELDDLAFGAHVVSLRVSPSRPALRARERPDAAAGDLPDAGRQDDRLCRRAGRGFLK